MDEDLRMREGHAFALGAAREQNRAHGGRHSGTDGRHVGLNEAHRIVNRQPRGYAAARAVDVHVDVFVRIFFFEEEQLRDHEVGQVIVYGTADEDDAILEQARVDVERALPACALLDDHGDQMTH
jgi:hypothetical protein